jgi:hypothetical protein
VDPSTAEIVSEAAYIHLQKRAMRAPMTAVPPAGPPAALAFGPVDIVAAPSLEAAVVLARQLTASWSSRVHWTRNYLRFRLRRASKRARRELSRR